MTTDKMTPTHSFSRSGQAAAPSTHDKPQCRGAWAPTRVELPRLTLSSFWLPTLRRQHSRRLHPEGPSGQVRHRRGSPQVCCLVLTWHLHFESSMIFSTTYSCSPFIPRSSTEPALWYSWISYYFYVFLKCVSFFVLKLDFFATHILM